MNEQAIINEIALEIKDEDNVAVQLHSFARFDDARFQRIITALSNYASLAGGKEDINKHVAAILFVLEQEFTNFMASDVYESWEESKQIQLQLAHQEVSDIINSLFFE